MVVRGVRVAAGLMLRYGANGYLELLNETAIAQQQPALPDGSNSTETLAGGWPAYEFSDGTGPFSGIARQDDGSSSVSLLSRSLAETSNRLSVEFQDETNEYQQDSLSLIDSDDTSLIGYEISSTSTALGIPNFNQANRVLLRQLDKLTKGNTLHPVPDKFPRIEGAAWRHHYRYVCEGGPTTDAFSCHEAIAVTKLPHGAGAGANSR